MEQVLSPPTLLPHSPFDNKNNELNELNENNELASNLGP